MIISKGAASRAKERRAAKKAASTNEIPLDLDPAFSKQNAFIMDKSRYIDAQCSRRAGKTNGLAIRFFQTMKKYPKSQCVYLSLTKS